ncbi:MAG: ABC transporter ATP-binding protein [Nitrososphaerota archaeon]|nr:ABC transporter ATP-binding protein [Nitrososphaerota archaeon]
MSDQMLRMTGIRKTFPGVVALDSVDFQADRGEVMGILGENGAGKSTLMNILFGLYSMDGGSIELEGKKVSMKSSADAIAHGLGMVHQAFTLVPNLTALENIILGSEPAHAGVIDSLAARQQVEGLIRQVGLGVDLDVLAEDLPTGFKQRVEILKALFRGAKVLILDEPTAVLTPLESEELFRSIRRLTQGGSTVIFITHKLKEVKAITNRITVMRKGKVVTTLDTKDATFDAMANAMVGRQIQRKFDFGTYQPGEVLLEVRDLTALSRHKTKALNGCNISVRTGEIVGVAGVEGNGQTELVECIMGMMKPTSGSVALNGRPTAGLSTSEILKLSVGHVPEDRALNGLILDFSIAENTVLGATKSPEFSRRGLMVPGRIRDFARRIVQSFNVSTAGIDVKARNLSGGNQQKVIVGRELSGEPHLLIAHQPTRGLDVASTEYIQTLIVNARNSGRGVLLVSADFDEILDLSDRIAVLYEGKIIGELKRGAGIGELGKLLGGVTGA